MIRPDKSLSTIYLYRKPVDFRKYANGLSLIVEHELGMDALSGKLFVFFNRNRHKIRILYWERTGFVLYSKSLEKNRFHLPKNANDIVTLNGEQLCWLLDGINIDLIRPHAAIYYDNVG